MGLNQGDAKSPPHSEASTIYEKSSSVKTNEEQPMQPPAEDRVSVNGAQSVFADAENQAVSQSCANPVSMNCLLIDFLTFLRPSGLGI